MSTATTVVELIALLRPSLCILCNRLAMPCMRFLLDSLPVALGLGHSEPHIPAGWLRCQPVTFSQQCLELSHPCEVRSVPYYPSALRSLAPYSKEPSKPANVHFLLKNWPNCFVPPRDNSPSLCALGSLQYAKLSYLLHRQSSRARDTSELVKLPSCDQDVTAATYKGVSPAEFCFINNSANSSSSVSSIVFFIATRFPALAAECKALSSRFPVNCFIIFFRGVVG
ncbi:hypothetical protein H5410_058755 [Solanum commersonii]|uniref:Secreted protein n=1 Tax=Solanum commersonii TaxID=4109 RepID=A0A9J5WTM4_SOLCO|nr:hypothetical protein H5410_058755 [Solanum commersonii]